MGEQNIMLIRQFISFKGRHIQK